MREDTEQVVIESIQAFMAAADEVYRVMNPPAGRFVSASARAREGEVAICKASIDAVVNAIHRGDPDPTIVGFAYAAEAQANRILDNIEESIKRENVHSV